MKKQFALSKETLRKLDDHTMEKVVGGWPPPNLSKNCHNTTIGPCGLLTNCYLTC